MDCSSASLDRWSSNAHAIQRCKSGHAFSLADWIESKSPRVGGRKTSRGVTMGIEWRIDRLPKFYSLFEREKVAGQAFCLRPFCRPVQELPFVRRPADSEDRFQDHPAV